MELEQIFDIEEVKICVDVKVVMYVYQWEVVYQRFQIKFYEKICIFFFINDIKL